MKKTATFIFLLICMSAGAQWIQVTIPTDNDFKNLSFIDNNKGFVITSDSVFITTNGGTSWTSNRVVSYPVGGTMSRCMFTDAMHGFVCCQAGYVYVTTDGGQTWLDRSTPDTPSSPYYVYSFGYLNGLWFNDNNNGWVVGDSGNIWKTTNAGVSWTKLASGTTQNLYCVHFIDANNGWAGGKNKTLLKTTNGGTSWTPVTISSLYFGSTHAVFPITSTTIFVADDAGYIYKSTDGSTFNSGSQAGFATINDMYWIDANNGYVVQQAGSAFYSSDGGATWTNMNLPGIGYNNLKGVSRAGNTTWISAQNGLLYKNTSSVGIKEVGKNENGISVFPNPSNGNFEINLNSNAPGSVTVLVTDLTGKTIYSNKEVIINSGKINVDLSDKNSGIYFCTIQTNSGVQTQKIIVNK